MPRTVTLLYFAVLRDLAGMAEEVVSLPDEVRTVADLARYLDAGRAAFSGRLGSVRFARNEAFSLADDEIRAGDVIALLPPVSGG